MALLLRHSQSISMKKNFSLLIISLVALVMLGLLRTQPALAHGGEPRLELGTERVNPGGVVEVRGVNFEYDEHLTLTLIGAQSETTLVEINADEAGEFQRVLTLPSTLDAGTYYLGAATEHHHVLSAALTVWGEAVMTEGAGVGQRDDADGLLAPMPTALANAVTQPVGNAPLNSQTPAAPRYGGWAIVALLGVSALLLWGLWRKRVSA